MKELRRIYQCYKPDIPQTGIVITLMVLSISVNLLKPWPLAVIVDSVLNNKTLPAFLQHIGFSNQNKLSLLAVMAIASVLLYICHSSLSAYQSYRAIAIGLRGLQRIRTELFSALQRLSLRFHHGSKAGDLIYRATWDAYSVQTIFQQGFISTLTSTITIILMLYIILQINIPLGIATICLMPIIVITMRGFGKKMMERGMEAQKADSQVITSVSQTISTLPLIQSYTTEEREQKRFALFTEIAKNKRLSQHKWELIYWWSVTTLFGIGSSAIIYIGAIQALNNKITVGQLLIFIAYLAQLYEPLNQISHSGSTVASALAGAKRVFEIIDSTEEIKDAPDARPVVRDESSATMVKNTSAKPPLIVKGEIEFDDVWFSYEPEKWVLSGISFKVLSGERVALIGPSGAGKTTLMNLVLRFYDPIKGEIRLDGEDLRNLRLKDLRRNIAVVLQEPIIIAGTIAENIAYGCDNVTFEQIQNAARAANAEDFILKLPGKYDTIVGEGAHKLSVGESQRINIARAFLKDAPILLLDEPTAALDAENESLILQSIINLMKNRTTLMIAHKLSTIKRVQKIIVLENGKITQIGSPVELESQDGYYKRVLSGLTGLG